MNVVDRSTIHCSDRDVPSDSRMTAYSTPSRKTCRIALLLPPPGLVIGLRLIPEAHTLRITHFLDPGRIEAISRWCERSEHHLRD